MDQVEFIREELETFFKEKKYFDLEEVAELFCAPNLYCL